MLENFTLKINQHEHYQACLGTQTFHVLFSNIYYDSTENSLCRKYLDQEALYCISKLGAAVLLASKL